MDPCEQHGVVIRKVDLALEAAQCSTQERLGARRCARGVGEDRFLDEAGDVVV
jgi:hypothetical protein